MDASESIGLGHLSRCMTIALALGERDVAVDFVMSAPRESERARLREAGFSVHAISGAPGSASDLEDTIQLVGQLGAGLVLVDGYHFSGEYIAALHGEDRFACFIDDLASMRFACGAVVNHNFYAERAELDASSDCVLLLGPRYALVRDAFVRARARRDRGDRGAARRVLVTFGGADPTLETPRVLRALARIDEALDVRVVIGPATPNGDEIAAAAAQCAHHEIQLLRGVSDLAPHMAWCDIALSAAGGTCMELACVGVPALVFAVADNQRNVASEVHRRGLMESLGWRADVTEDALAAAVTRLLRDHARREAMVRAQHATVDGLGAARVVDTILQASRMFERGSVGVG